MENKKKAANDKMANGAKVAKDAADKGAANGGEAAK